MCCISLQHIFYQSVVACSVFFNDVVCWGNDEGQLSAEEIDQEVFVAAGRGGLLCGVSGGG